MYRQLVQRQLQGGLSLSNLPSIAENGHGPEDDVAAADDSGRSDTDDEMCVDAHGGRRDGRKL